VRTKGYEGAHEWSAKVTTNDPNKNIFYLKITAFVRVPIYVKPRYVRLSGREGQSVTRVIEIRAGLDKNLMLKPSQFTLEGKVKYTIEEMEKGRRFRIHFISIPEVAGAYMGFLNLETNYDEKPVLNIRISGRFVKANKRSE
jgi:hypothetical protein